MKTFYQFLQVTCARTFEHLSFNLLSFDFFKNSESGNVLYFGNPPPLLAPLAFIPYILAMEIIHFRGKRYFVKFMEHVVGIFSLQEKPNALFIGSLAVAPQYRNFGIGTYILTYAENVAKRMNKKWLELSVLKVNTPAIRLYMKFGFEEKEKKKRSFILRKWLKNN